MLFAAFSHANLLHIFLNMYVMLSFIQAWERYATTRRHTMPQVNQLYGNRNIALFAGSVYSLLDYIVSLFKEILLEIGFIEEKITA